MKSIVVYSSDSNICLSLLMYLQNDYSVTTTTDLDVLRVMAKNITFDMIIIDAEPSKAIEETCKELREQNPSIPIILTYVYENNSKVFDSKLRKYASSIFYKPFDLTEVTKELTGLLV
jgi:DNA-binding response OmpR family regulator